MKELQKLIFAPGINREGTNYSAEGFWWDCNRVRFRNGLPETIGGWVKATTATFLGVCRKMLNWQTLAADDMLALGTSKKLYINNADAFSDITPIRATFLKNNPITTGAAGTSIITISTTTAHGADPGDYVSLSLAADTDGILAAALNTEHLILTTPTTTSFTVDVGSICTLGGITGGGNGVGAGVIIDFQIHPGADAAFVGSGYGVGPYSRGAYSSESTTIYSSSTNLRLWSLANYGEDLIAAPRGGAIYRWKASDGLAQRAVALSTLVGATGVPDEVGMVLVTQERHMLAFGATDLITAQFDPLLIRWCTQEDILDWTPTIVNTSGDYRLTSGSSIIAASASRDEILVWTDSSLHSMRYTGPPFVYDIRSISENVSLVSPNAILTINNVTYWMGHGKFFLYNGVAQSIPCSVRRHVFSDFSMAQSKQVHCGAHPEFNEVWWFYCSMDAVQCDKYVVYNFIDNIWYYGDMARSSCVDASIRMQMLATQDGVLYVQEAGIEDGSTAPASPLGAFIESSDFDIQDGTSFYYVERILPDIRFDRSTSIAPEVHFTLKARDFPGQNYHTQTPMDAATGVIRTASLPVDQYTKELWVRVRGRHLALRVEMDADDVGTAWQLGAPRIGVRTDGRR